MAALDRDIPIQSNWYAAEEEGERFGNVIDRDDEYQYVYSESISSDRADNPQDEENDGDSDRETGCRVDFLLGKLHLISLLDLYSQTFVMGNSGGSYLQKPRTELMQRKDIQMISQTKACRCFANSAVSIPRSRRPWEKDIR